MDKPQGLSRREALGAGAAAMFALWAEPGLMTEARAQGATLRTDVRFPFADRLADLVIPETDTPGASAANVGGFLLFALDRGMGAMTPAMLDAVAADLKGAGGGDFMRLAREQQGTLLAALDARAYAIARPGTDTVEFAWRRIKTAIVAGYYTSEIGATQELVYEPVPGSTRSFRMTPDFRARSHDGFGGTL